MRTRWKQMLAGVAGLGMFGALYARFLEPGQVYLDRFTVAMDRPGLPPEGLTLLHLTDLHCRTRDAVQTARLARLRRLLAGEKYDLLLVTGDLIHNTAGIPAALDFLATLHPRLGAFSCPGNRDYWESSISVLLGSPEQRAGKSWGEQVTTAARQLGAFVRRAVRNERWLLHIYRNDINALHAALAAQGIQPLVNRAVHIRTGGADLWIAGVDDLTQGQPDVAAALADVPEGALTILLAHNPDAALDPGVQRVHLVLAGHTHGGQVRLPGIGALYTQGGHLPRRRPAGWFERGPATRMFVSRGLGQSFPFRFGAPPQAVLLRVEPAGEDT
jgi:predicted MPP superfamily phosphohydrolase